MKILQLVDVPWDSGLAHYALTLSLELQKAGHQVFVSAIPGQKPWVKAQRLGLSTVPFSTLSKLPSLRRFLKEQGIQVMNAHTGATHSLALAGALGQPVSVVRTRSDARKLRARMGSGFMFKKTHHVIAAAKYIHDEYLRELRLPPSKVTTIYQGVDVDAFEPKPLPSAPTVGIVARLDPVKGHRYLIEALSLLKNSYPDLTIRIIGQEENIKQKDLKVIAERLRIEDRIDFLGYQTDISKAMAACSVGVIASVGSEAVSRVALEWMSAGRAVVATRVGCLPEIVQDLITGRVIDPKDAPQLAIALGIVFHDPALLSSMGKAGRDRVKDRFGLKQFVQDTLAVYESAIKLASRGR